VTSYTVFGQPSAPATIVSDNGAETLGMQFSLNQSLPLTGIWWFSPSGAVDLPTACGIFQVNNTTLVAGTSNVSPSWSGAAGSGWVKCSYNGAVTLFANTAYKVVISHDAGNNYYGATAHYWDSGTGQNGLTSGPITAVNNAGGDGGQDTYATASSLTYPSASFNANNYWVDVEVTTPQNVLGSAVGTSAASPATTPGANLAAQPHTSSSGGIAGQGLAGLSTSGANDTLGPYTYAPISSSDNNTLVNNNVWNSGGADYWSQTLTIVTPGNWGITANISDGGSGAVISYPDVEQLYNEKPLSSWTDITSSYSETMNANPGSWTEAAYDIWLNQFANELMIWVDTTPLQRATLNYDLHYGQVTIGGLLFDYYHGGGAAEIIYCLVTNMQAATIDVLGVLRHAEANGLLPANSNLTALEFGWEIANTGAGPQTFELFSYSITEVEPTTANFPGGFFPFNAYNNPGFKGFSAAARGQR
jgi:Domain of unknown function (DUF4082)